MNDLGRRRWLTRAAVIAPFVLASGRATADAGKVGAGTLYHVNEGLEQAKRALGFIVNHLQADPSARIAVVAHSQGLTFLIAEQTDPAAKDFPLLVKGLVARGVAFRACRNTLDHLNLEPSALIPGVAVVPSGVAEVSRAQTVDHFAYLKP